ncbi:MAG: hypothetical protein ACLTTZ_07235 [Lachnospiraceae bacterium]
MKTRFLKTAAAVMAVVMCLGMTVFAAPSPSGSDFVVGGISNAVDADGNDISGFLEVTELPDEYADAAAQIRTAEGLQAAMGADYNENMIVLDIVEARVVGDASQVKFPVTITFQVNGVTASTRGTILHYTGSEWEKIPTTMGEGTMTGTFASLSPVAFVVDKTTLTGGTVSPKTSAQSAAAVALLGLLAATAACGMKKRSMER